MSKGELFGLYGVYFMKIYLHIPSSALYSQLQLPITYRKSGKILNAIAIF